MIAEWGAGAVGKRSGFFNPGYLLLLYEEDTWGCARRVSARPKLVFPPTEYQVASAEDQHSALPLCISQHIN